MQVSLKDYGPVEHIEGSGLWDGSVWQDGLDANSSEIIGGGWGARYGQKGIDSPPI